jgi:hypothetical protein
MISCEINTTDSDGQPVVLLVDIRKYRETAGFLWWKPILWLDYIVTGYIDNTGSHSGRPTGIDPIEEAKEVLEYARDNWED